MQTEHITSWWCVPCTPPSSSKPVPVHRHEVDTKVREVFTIRGRQPIIGHSHCWKHLHSTSKILFRHFSVIMKSSQTFVYTALTITRWRKLELLICRQYLPPYPSPLKQQLLTSHHDTSQLCNVHITSDLVSNVLPIWMFRRVPMPGGEAGGGAGARGQHHWSVARLLSWHITSHDLLWPAPGVTISVLVLLAALLSAAGLLLYRHTHCSAPRPKQSSQLVTRQLQGEQAACHHFVTFCQNMK